MGRKKIQISRIGDERNRQVGGSAVYKTKGMLSSHVTDVTGMTSCSDLVRDVIKTSPDEFYDRAYVTDVTGMTSCSDLVRDVIKTSPHEFYDCAYTFRLVCDVFRHARRNQLYER